MKRISGDDTGSKHCTGQYFDYLACVDKCVNCLILLLTMLLFWLLFLLICNFEFGSMVNAASCPKAICKAEISGSLLIIKDAFSLMCYSCPNI